MSGAECRMHTRLGSGELDRRLRLRLHDLFNPEVFDLEAVGFVQLIDQGEFNFITLLHDQGRGPNPANTLFTSACT